MADVRPLLDRMPVLAGRLETAPKAELRALFDALQLEVAYQPADSAVDVTLTLYDGGENWRTDTAKAASEDSLAPPARFERATHGLGNRCSIP